MALLHRGNRYGHSYSKSESCNSTDISIRILVPRGSALTWYTKITYRRPTHTPGTRCQTSTGATTVTPGTPLQCFATRFGLASPSQFPSYCGRLTFNTGLVIQRVSSPA